MKKIYTLVVCLILFMAQAQSQNNIGIGTPNPDASSILDLTSNNKGLLVPRVTRLQRLAIASPANGLLVYDTDSSCFYYYQL